MIQKYQKMISIIIFVLIIFTIAIPVIYKTHKTYKEKLYSSIEAKITEKALKCYNEDKCPDKKITLQELYDKEYLDEIINPINNEYMNPKSYIEISSSAEAKLIIIDE